MRQGLIIKSTGGQYDVREDVSGETFFCKARGKFRLENMFPLAGDRVEFMPQKSSEDVCMIQSICPRKNKLIRPPVANVDRLVIVASLAPPVTEMFAVDLMAAIAEYNGIEPVICINKTDIAPAEEFAEVYRKAGYRVLTVSAAENTNIDSLANVMDTGLTVLAGASGVGKSSLLNRLDAEAAAKTSAVSEKIGRGRHTTRHVELFRVRDGYIVDTPGFSSVDAMQMEFYDKTALAECFPEFRKYLGKCEYADCAHIRETGCAVRDAVNAGEIDAGRHKSYASIVNSLSELREWQVKRLKDKA